ncbi:MAG: DegT/DnrJ/EryC1/StrS family aminotransferase [Deltaproteobacteria bacterium]|jgi:dTDP-4-amino-4,6-dideoxygalactose transaminase|nr:DegT/DnrJ/EryC1/StrS family aminotransferase [Deltaproteobacteria bacterium]
MNIPVVKMPFSDGDIEEISKELAALLKGGHISMGEKTLAFEEEFARFVGSKYAVSVANGTMAIELLCQALELSGASVMIPDLTFMATAFAPMAAGAKIVLVDTDPKTLQMDYQDAVKKMRPDVRALILVHLGGFISPDLSKLRELAHENGAVFLEDAAHAHGASLEGTLAGCLGDGAAFSFYATKVLTTSEGGMVTADDQELITRMRAIRQHGQMRPGSNVHEHFGLNFRPSEIHALLGLNVLKRAEEILHDRRAAALSYDTLLANSPIRPILPAEGVLPSYYKYIALLPEGVDRDLFKKALKERFNLSLAGEVYSLAISQQPFWSCNPEYLAEPIDGGPLNSHVAAKRHICLPIWPKIPKKDQAEVVSALHSALEGF